MNQSIVFYCFISFTVLVVSAHSISPNRCLKENGEPIHISFVSVPTKGHINPLIGSAQQLARLGCRVTIPISGSKTHWVSPYEEIEIVTVPEEEDISVKERREFLEEEKDNFFVSMLKGGGKKKAMIKRLLVDMVTPFAEFLMEEHKQGRYNPDILVTEKMLPSIGDLGIVLGTQIVYLNPGLLMHWDGTSFHYIPTFSSGFTLDMNYFQRVINHLISPTLFSFFMPMFFSPVVEMRENLGITDKLPPYMLSTNFTGLEMSQVFFGFEYAQPLPPNHFLVGPALPLTLKQLPDRIVDWIGKHNDKPIFYMCMGTVATFTADMIKPLLEAFTNQEFSVIWSFPNNQRDILEGISIPANVHLEDFLPQRELLLREEIVAFISHTGASSSNEAVTSGTPVICLPFMGDQFEFCNRLVAAGMAIHLDKFTMQVDQIRSALANITTPAFVNNAKRMQQLAQAAGGAEKVAELILSSYHEGVGHLIPNKHFLPWYQAQALDLRVTQFVFVFCLPFVFYFAGRMLLCCCGCCFGRKGKGKKTTKIE